MNISRKVIEYTNFKKYLDVKTNASHFQIYLIDNHTIRFRCTFDNAFKPEQSYALVKTAWEDQLDNVLKKERKKVEPIPVNLEDNGIQLTFGTSKLIVKIQKEPFTIRVYDSNGRALHEDLPERSFMVDSLGRRYHYSVMKDSYHYFGFGEKTGPLNKKKRRMRMHNVDTVGYDAELSDPLYKHIPFYIQFDEDTRQANGIFYNNSFDCEFDVGRERSGYWDKYTYYVTDGGDIDFFFIYGPQIHDVVEHYTDLTGKTALPPKVSLGYMGSTMYYTELDHGSDKAILSFLDKCKAEGIPCDGFFMSSGYTTGEDGKRYVFNWNYDRFSDPEAFIKSMKEKGALVAPNVKPGMLTTHPLYKEFSESGAYIKTEKNEPATDRYWGGPASFVDFTSPEGRKIWKDYLKNSLIKYGITSIWDDNNEYEINESNNLINGDGIKQKIAGFKPIMSLMMAFTAREAIYEVDPNARPYIISRAGFAGIQRYAQTWAGDNNTSWNTLKYNIPTILGMGLSGVANQGCDIGGFFGKAPEPELFVRWVQNGIFQPRFSIHSSNTDNTVTEPWMYPSYTKYIAKAIQLRYQFVPYLYSLLYESSKKGYPVLRPLVYEFPDDIEAIDESFEFMFGHSLLVANVIDKGQKVKEIYLPAGTGWYDWDSKQYYTGGQYISYPVNLDTIPLFIREGAIIPLYENLMNIHNDHPEKLTLLVEPSKDSSFILYDDDGISNNSDFVQININHTQTEVASVFDFSKEGNYDNGIKTIQMNLIYREIAPITIEVSGQTVKKFLDIKEWNSSEEGWFLDMEKKIAKIKYPSPAGDYRVVVHFDVKDLISM